MEENIILQLNSQYSHLERIQIDSEKEFNEMNQKLDSESEKYRTVLKNLTKLNKNSEKLLHDVNDRLSSNNEAKTLQINDLVLQIDKASEDLVNLQKNVTAMTSNSEKLLHDMMSNFRTGVTDQLENLNDILGIESENKTLQIKSLLKQINRTSDDLQNLHMKTGDITTSLDSLDDIRRHLIEESAKNIQKSENISRDNEATRQFLKNVTENENREISSFVIKVLERMDILHNYLGQGIIDGYIWINMNNEYLHIYY